MTRLDTSYVVTLTLDKCAYMYMYGFSLQVEKKLEGGTLVS